MRENTQHRRIASAAASRLKPGWALGLGLLACLGGRCDATAAPFGISSFTRTCQVAWTNAFPAGVCNVQTAPSAAGPWTPVTNVFTTNSSGTITIPQPTLASNIMVRLLASDISAASPAGFANLTQCYGLIHTIAGSGGGDTDGVNYWQPSFEGEFATNAALSRPHFAQADAAGNIFIADKDSHSILKITPEGRIHTAAGTHAAGNGPDTATVATNVALSYPNGLWVGGDGSVYVLDTENGKVRWLATNGLLTTLFTYPGGFGGGRGIWVRDDRTLAYFVEGNDIRRWSSTAGFKKINNNNFTDPGNLLVRPDGNLLITDRGSHQVYLLNVTTGNHSVRFGDGTMNPVIDGTSALSNSLYGVRGIWPMPTSGYLLATHEGSQILYVDPADRLHVLVDGYAGFHYGDAEWFYTPGWKVSEPRSVTMDAHGNLLIVESDYGFLRQVDFQRLTP
jgi:hypothetical protein